jgi:hypothetical protein
MTPSIIRRFARYHGINIEIDGDSTEWGMEEIAIALYGNLATPNVLRVVQSLTRIEDAEMLLGRVTEASKTLAYHGMDDNIVASTVRDFYAFDVDRLLVLAGVNPAKWREVKDEET